MTTPAERSPGELAEAVVAEEESATKRMAFYRVTVRRADGAVVALFRGTVYQTQRMHELES